MEDLAGEDNEEALFVENGRGKNTSDNNFRYKIYWYNNFSISIVTQNSFNIEPNNQKTHSNDDNKSSKILKIIYWDSTYEVKDKDDNDFFYYWRTLMNSTSKIGPKMLNWFNIDYYNNGLAIIPPIFDRSNSNTTNFHTK